MKMYYVLIDPTIKPCINTYWHGDNSSANFLTRLRGFVLPLGTRKPKNLTGSTVQDIFEF